MAQAPTAADLPSERAVSSEPCATRPNPFDDGDLSSRKRRRTSHASGSRSRSVETIDSPRDSPARGTPAPEPTGEAAMKVDSDPVSPSTPEKQLRDAEQTPAPTSSRVTINVRTPSQPLDPIPSTPPSPSPNPSVPQAASGSDAVRASTEKPEAAATGPDEAAVETAVSPRLNSESPQIEVVSVDGDDDVEFEDEDEPVTVLDASGRSLTYDPAFDFPFHDAPETHLDTIIRLGQYLPTREFPGCLPTRHVAEPRQR